MSEWYIGQRFSVCQIILFLEEIYLMQWSFRNERENVSKCLLVSPGWNASLTKISKQNSLKVEKNERHYFLLRTAPKKSLPECSWYAIVHNFMPLIPPSSPIYIHSNLTFSISLKLIPTDEDPKSGRYLATIWRKVWSCSLKIYDRRTRHRSMLRW